MTDIKADAVIRLISEYRKERQITSKKIEVLLRVPGTFVREIVREARRNGLPIGSSSKGYYLIEKESELEETVRHLKSRAMSELRTYNIMKRFKFEEFPLQLQLFGEAV